MVILEISQLCGFMVDMWTSVISWFNSAIGNYAWAVIVITLLIKLVMLPLDFFNKKTTRKNNKMQAIIQPELEKVKQKYGNDRNLLNQKTSEVYQKHGYNVVGSCLFMLVNLALTLTIFITLFNGLNAMASTKIIGQYDDLKQTYEIAYSQKYLESIDETASIEYANYQVKIKYDQIKESWLWIDNVWKADMPTKSIPKFSEYLKIAGEVTIDDGQQVKANKLSDEQKEVLEVEYETVMGPLRDTSRKANGFIILPVLIFASGFFAQWITTRKNKKLNPQPKTVLKDKDGKPVPNPMESSGKIMMFMLPAMLTFFSLTSNSVFAVYLLVSQLVSLASTPLIDLILDKIEVMEEKRKKVTVENVSYSRNNTQVYQETKKENKKIAIKQDKQKKSKNNNDNNQKIAQNEEKNANENKNQDLKSEDKSDKK